MQFENVELVKKEQLPFVLKLIILIGNYDIRTRATVQFVSTILDTELNYLVPLNYHSIDDQLYRLSVRHISDIAGA